MAFNVISNITLDMKHVYSVSNIVQVNQYDTAGVIKAQLLNDGAKWSVPQGAKPVVMFKKTDNIGGFYDVTDTNPETAAVSIDTDRSIIYISLDPQTTTTATSNGKYVDMQVAFFENGLRISTFAFYMQVLPSVITSGDLLGSSWIFNILSKEIADTLTVATTPDAMTEWLEANITQETGYVIDNTLTVAGAASDAEATGKMVVVSDQNPNRTANKVWVKKTPSEVQIPTVEELDEVKSALIISDPINVDWVLGGITKANGRNANNQRRVRTNNFIQVSPRQGITIIVDAGHKFTLYGYSSSSIGSYIGQITNEWQTGEKTLNDLPSNCNYIRIVGARANENENITVDETSGFVIKLNRITDTTLSEAGIPADAKTTGARLNAIKSTIGLDESISNVWEQGNIDPNTGAQSTTDYNYRIRLYSYLDTRLGLRVIIPEGIRIAAYHYTDITYTSYDGYSGWLTGIQEFQEYGYYKFVAAYVEDNVDITPDAAANILITRISYTDSSMSIPNKAADAKVVGDLLQNKMGYVRALRNNNGDLLNNVVEPGIYRWTAAYAPEDAPTKVPSTLIVTGSTAKSIEGKTQIVFDVYGYIFIRVAYSAGWASWYKLHPEDTSFTVGRELTQEDDLNNIENSGIYHWVSSSIPINTPTNSGGTLLSFKFNNIYTTQFFIAGYSRVYTRTRTSQGFGYWTLLNYPKSYLPIRIQKGAWQSSGRVVVNSVKGLCCDQVFSLTQGSVLRFYLDDGWTYTIREGDNLTELIDITAHLSNQAEHIVSHPYVAINFNKLDENGKAVNLTVNDWNDNAIIETSGFAVKENVKQNEYHDFPESSGQLAIISRAYQLSKLSYTTVNTLPMHSGGSMTVTQADVPENTDVEGCVYSSMRETMDSVPQAVSFHSYMTALKNPNSYIYTKHYSGEAPGYDYNSRCYYGAVCSTLVAYCYGIDDVIPTTLSFANYPGLTPLPSAQQTPYDLKLGDMLNLAGDHIVVVTDIIRNYRGKIKTIEVTEAWKPLCRSMSYSSERIKSRYFDNGYVAYRLDSYDTVRYTPDPWVHVDDTENEEPIYSELLCPRRGDKANWKVGDTIEIDVLNSTGYTGYSVKNLTTEEVVDTGAIPANNLISLIRLPAGRYSAVLTGGADNIPVYFDIIDMNVTYQALDNHQVRVTYSSEFGTPSAIYWCCNKITYSGHKAAVAFHLLSEEEISAGFAVVDEPTEYRSAYTTNDTWLMRMNFKAPFGLIASNLTEVTMA